MACETDGGLAKRSRGDRQREAIVAAVGELLQHCTIAELSVRAVSQRAGVARSGFYFYFDSKYAVLAAMLANVMDELAAVTHDFAPREPGEPLAAFAKRMIGSAAAVYASNDPVMRACMAAQNTDPQIRELLAGFQDTVIARIVALVEQDPDVSPITGDVEALVRLLAAATSMTLSRDRGFIGSGDDPARAIDALEQLWQGALWGGPLPPG